MRFVEDKLALSGEKSKRYQYSETSSSRYYKRYREKERSSNKLVIINVETVTVVGVVREEHSNTSRF